MKRKYLFALIAVFTVFALALAACGSKTETQETVPTAADLPLGLTSWDLSTTTWSSPNGATVNLSAVPSRHATDDTARFVVRLEGEEIASSPCAFDGTHYTASADLNAEDGYCYYVILASGDGEQLEVAVNTPAEPTNEALINMASALESYCNILVDGSNFSGGKLTITEGTAQIQLPRITNAGETVTCKEAVLSLQYNGEVVDKQTLKLGEADDDSRYEQDLSNVSFSLPAMEDDQQLTMALDVTLSNGQELSANGGTWYYSGGELLLAVG